ncbi:MAG: hypothetical protein NTY53_01395, partial [Kiritimatiellaeota bacterium]|nr:hypothetical protein [Kiritimatiellota bacterium]
KRQMILACRKQFPSLGKVSVRFFQALEKISPTSSKPWKNRCCAFPSLGKSALLALMLLAPLSAPALIFERWGTRGHDPIRALMLGEHPAYTTSMKLNGSAGELEVYMCEGSPAKILERLAAGYQALGAQVFCVSGPKLGWGLVMDGGRIIRFVVANTGQHNSSTVFRIEQSEAEFARSQRAPTMPLPADVPIFPGVRWTQSIQNEAAHSTIATATVSVDANTVLHYYADMLPRTGWTPGLGPRDQASGIYVRGSEMLLVNANSSGVRGQTVVIFLHKHLK